MEQKIKHPYNYRSVALTSVKGSATFTGKPSKKQLEAVNLLAELAMKELENKK